MESANKALLDLVVAHRADAALQLNPLSMKINGIVDAAVMGGVTNYEEVSLAQFWCYVVLPCLFQCSRVFNVEIEHWSQNQISVSHQKCIWC